MDADRFTALLDRAAPEVDADEAWQETHTRMTHDRRRRAAMSGAALVVALLVFVALVGASVARRGEGSIDFSTNSQPTTTPTTAPSAEDLAAPDVLDLGCDEHAVSVPPRVRTSA